MVAEDSFHDVTEELNRRSRLAQFIGGHVATPSELDDDVEQGTPSAATEGDPMEVEEEPNYHGNEWP